MRDAILKWMVSGRMLVGLLKEEHGQDLVEYAAVISLVVLGITAGMTTLAQGINAAMTSVSSAINNTIG